MKAFRYLGPGRAEIQEMPTPELGPGEVLVTVRACGICGTDVKTFKRGHPKIPAGTVLGHEAAGVVSASNSPDFSPGERVVIAPYTPCLACEFCRRGQYNLCENLNDTYLEPGGFAEQVKVPPRIVSQGLLHIPESLDFETASLTEPLACCLHGLETLDVQPGHSLLIIGDGPMGLLQAALGKSMNAGPVILGGVTPHRLDVARRIADVVLDVSRSSLIDQVKDVVPGGVDRISVAVAIPTLVEDALVLARKGGAINLFAGLPRETFITLDPYRIHYDEVKIVGTFGFCPDHFRRALELLAGGTLNTSELVTGRVSLDQVKDALVRASKFEGIKTVVTIPGSA